MPNFAKELPPYAKQYATEPSITSGEALRLREDVSRLGDRYLATCYVELPTHARMSILADMLEAEMIMRFVDQNLMVPELVLEDESVAVGAI